MDSSRPDAAERADRPFRSTVPPGWQENPTSYGRRAVLAALAATGFVIATYLSLFQLGVFDAVWDPLFASRPVLELTEPVPDAVAGVLAYATEVLLLIIGRADRWRTSPWVCLLLGFVLCVGAVVSVGLILTQAVVVHAWCTLCLASAVLSFVLFALGIGEARAAYQQLQRVTARRVPLLDALRGHGASWFDAAR